MTTGREDRAQFVARVEEACRHDIGIIAPLMKVVTEKSIMAILSGDLSPEVRAFIILAGCRPYIYGSGAKELEDVLPLVVTNCTLCDGKSTCRCAQLQKMFGAARVLGETIEAFMEDPEIKALVEKVKGR